MMSVADVSLDGLQDGTLALVDGKRQPPPLGDGADGRAATIRATRPGSRTTRGTTVAMVDVVGLVLAVLLVVMGQPLLRQAGLSAPTTAGVDPVGETALFALVCIPILAVLLTETRRHPRLRLGSGLVEHIRQIASPLAVGALVSLVVWKLSALAGLRPASVSTYPSAGFVTAVMVSTAALATVSVSRLVFANTVARRRGPTRVVIVGSGQVASLIDERLSWIRGIEVAGFVDDNPENPDRWLGDLSALPQVCESEAAGHVLVAFSRARSERLVESLRPLQGVVPISIVPRMFDLLPADAPVHDLGGGLPAIGVPLSESTVVPRALKRITDLCGAVVALIVFAPLLLCAAMAIRLTSEGPVVLRQKRVGRGGRMFDMYKFRSMMRSDVPDSLIGDVAPAPSLDGCTSMPPVVGPFHRIARDSLVTPVGRVIRRLCIDELPQLVNVLKGDMSLVGPRPFVKEDAAQINEPVARRRLSVRPGITGLWQVSGRNELSLAEMCRLDQVYVSCWTLGLDLRILLRTVRAVLYGRGAL